jgi:transcriptional regulator with XRE-family HTH domain
LGFSRMLARAVGISPAIITRYTQGKVGEPTTATMQKLADYFGVPVAYLRGEGDVLNERGGKTPPGSIEREGLEILGAELDKLSTSGEKFDLVADLREFLRKRRDQ